MKARNTTKWLAAFVITVACAAAARGQNTMGPFFSPFECDEFCGNCEYDAQWFAPVDFDFDCQPLRQECGYFFRFDKLNWAFTGERTTIGDPNLVVLSENIFGDSDFSEGDPPPQYQINNSIQDSPPDAEFGWGERYELGYFNKGCGWLVGVLDGPTAVSQKTFGFRELQVPNTIPLEGSPAPIPIPDDGSFTATLINALGNSGIPGTGSFDLSTSRNGFGSVHVNFATPEGYLLGFRDYHINGADNSQAPTSGGPGRRIQTITFTEEIDEITGDTRTVISDVTIIQGGDGLTDNLDGDNIAGFFVVIGVDIDGNEVIIGDGVDFDDLHMFNIRFDTFQVRNTTETQGIELMRTYELDNRHKMTKNQGRRASIAYGVRYLRLRDEFYWEGRGDILGRTFADTRAQNSIVGPQIRGNWNAQHGRWNLALDGRFIFGYNVQDLDQEGAIGEDLAPGATNSLVGAQPHAVSYGRRENDFSPVAEFRAEASYRLTHAVSMRLGYNAMFIDNITRASQTVRWYLPDLGLLKGGQQDIFINGANFGFDVVY